MKEREKRLKTIIKALRDTKNKMKKQHHYGEKNVLIEEEKNWMLIRTFSNIMLKLPFKFES